MTYDTLFVEFSEYSKMTEMEIDSFFKTQNVDYQDGIHILFGMVVVPFVINLVKSDDVIRLRLSFDFFEKMAKSENKDITEVLEFTLLENFVSLDEKLMKKLIAFMGEETISSLHNVQKFMME